MFSVFYDIFDKKKRILDIICANLQGGIRMIKGFRALKQKIFDEIIDPSVSKEAIREKAASLGFGESLSKEQARTVYNTLFYGTLKKVVAFMESDQAREICKNIDLIDKGAPLGKYIRRDLKKNIFALYQLPAFDPNRNIWAEQEPPSLLNWLWSFIPGTSS